MHFVVDVKNHEKLLLVALYVFSHLEFSRNPEKHRSKGFEVKRIMMKSLKMAATSYKFGRSFLLSSKRRTTDTTVNPLCRSVVSAISSSAWLRSCN